MQMHYELSNCAAEFLNLCQSQFVAFHGVYHELLEKEAALQNVEDPHMRAELEIQGEPGVWDLWSNQNHFFPRVTDAISTMA
ncbi:hypothetical protein T03_14207 [Trichinella britovi]|uniref:Uncharacterized protein n=1 Tax=Trichinella britovi TaxID=45882 RepID=A0A0V1BWG7_TRIBR|nr:hypothetical protein T03_14207 [Trichinella britovi]